MRKQILVAKNLGGKLVLVLAAMFILAPSAALADTYPFFKVSGGDAWAGGWFNSGNNACQTSNSSYQDASFPSTDGYQGFQSSYIPRYGGVDAYSQENASGGTGSYVGGASGDFGVYALGSAFGGSDASGNTYGFASGRAYTSNKVNSLTFANTNPGANSWGGKFEGATPQVHCIPDYYSKKPASTSSFTSLNSITSSGIYAADSTGATPLSLDSAAWTVPSNSQITVYINGPAYIGSNISYPSGITVDNVPKFALVVKGSLYIGPNVTELDGFYIAQPDLSDNTALKDNTGEIWTCHDDNFSSVSYTYPISSCTNSLTINGAMVAKRVNMLKIGSTSASQLTENFNYTSAMVVNGPFFNPPSSSTLKIESLVNLPPVF